MAPAFIGLLASIPPWPRRLAAFETHMFGTQHDSNVANLHEVDENCRIGVRL